MFSLNLQKTMSEIGQLIPELNATKIFKQFELASQAGYTILQIIDKLMDIKSTSNGYFCYTNFVRNSCDKKLKRILYNK